jgi:hypothetical protein
MILAIDFDGVIHDPKRVPPKHRMGVPIDGAIKAMQQLRQAGHVLIIYTVRGNSEGGIRSCEDWLNYFDIPFDRVTAYKPNADIYIDDKAIRFETWEQTLEGIGMTTVEKGNTEFTG